MRSSGEGWRKGVGPREDGCRTNDEISFVDAYRCREKTAIIGRNTLPLPFASVSQGVITAVTGAGITIALRRAFIGGGSMSSSANILQTSESSSPSVTVSAAATLTSSSVQPTTATTATAPPAPPQPDGKPAHDVVAGAVARAASQSTIHPLDTMKVRMQAGRKTSKINTSPARSTISSKSGSSQTTTLNRSLHEVKGLYKGVVGAATGAGLIIGTYFAFYSTTKRFLREHSQLHEGATAFVAGATAALGSSVVKVPLAVCIRSVQAGIYKNVFHAGQSIVSAAGVRGLFTGFVPTILEDVPDMAVKFAVYETLRKVHGQLSEGRPANVAEDLVMGGIAGAAAAAATTPLDVVKTVMMCSASSRPSFMGAARSVMRDGKGLRPFFRGVGPRALSNGLNSAIFFCFFEAIRQVLITKQQQKKELLLSAKDNNRDTSLSKTKLVHSTRLLTDDKARKSAALHREHGAEQPLRPVGSVAACLSLALPVPSKQSSL